MPGTPTSRGYPTYTTADAPNGPAQMAALAAAVNADANSLAAGIADAAARADALRRTAVDRCGILSGATEQVLGVDGQQTLSANDASRSLFAFSPAPPSEPAGTRMVLRVLLATNTAGAVSNTIVRVRPVTGVVVVSGVPSAVVDTTVTVMALTTNNVNGAVANVSPETALPTSSFGYVITAVKGGGGGPVAVRATLTFRLGS